MIEEIKRIFDDIRDAIIEMGGNIDFCTSPEDYDEAIKTLIGNNAVLCVPVFKSSDLKPDTPTSVMSSNAPTAYPEGWSTPDGLTGNIWMSYTIVGPTSVYVPWTEPILIRNSRDIAPDTYDDATTRTFLIFLELPDINLVPSRPTGGAWNVTENRLVGDIASELSKNGASIGRTTTDWSSDNNHVDGCYTWMSMGTFIAETGEIMGNWSEPVCINGVRDGKDGKDGRNGVDGESIEFIYKRCADEDTARLVPTPDSEPETDDYVPTGWTDSPSGIDPVNYKVEIMCSRKKDKETGNWGPFIGPVMWAIWGEDGTDGDGVEYIFRIASQNEVIDNNDGSYTLKTEFWPPICGEGCASAFLTVARNSEGYTTEEAALELYQQDEFVPGNLPGHPDAASLGWDRNWTDDPLDVSPSQPFEFCSIRKYNGETGQWSWFSNPVLWNKFWSGYAPVFTSFAFTRSRLKLGSMQLEGGDTSNPLPDPQTITQTIDGTQVTETINWFDTVPGPEDFENPEIGHAPIWMTTKQFGSIDPDAEEQDQSWESPRIISDNKFFNVEYSNSDVVTISTRLPRFDERINNEYPFIDNNDPEGVNESAWRQYCTQNSLGVWSDNVSNPKWMATSSLINGKWTEWSLTQIKGERGADGAGEETVYIRTNTNVAPTVSSAAADSHNKTYLDDDYLPMASGGDLAAATECTDDPQGADFYHKFEWEAKRKKIADPNDSTGKVKIWEQYSGTMHLHTNWAENGADGTSREWVYKRQTANPGTPPSSGNGEISPGNHAANGNVVYNDQLADWVPNGWWDSPQGIASTDKTEWASYRDYDNITRKWGSFNPAKIWSQWGEKGEDGDGVQYVYKLFDHELTAAERTSNIPAKPASQTSDGEWIPTGWSDDPQAPTVSMPYCYCSTIKRINGEWESQFGELGLWAKFAKDGETGPQGPQGNPGSKGDNGPRLRMRNWDYYTNPDAEGLGEWQCGDNDTDTFYDIAIWPVAEEGITITNAASNADRLWRCKQNIKYSSVPANANPSTLPDYFVQAEGWDFVATKLLLSDKIAANQIDVNQLSVKELHTSNNSGETLDIMNNVINLQQDGQIRCKISGENVSTNFDNHKQIIVGTTPGNEFLGGAVIDDTARTGNSAYFEGTYTLGTVHINSVSSGTQRDLIYSENFAQEWSVYLKAQGLQEAISGHSINCSVSLEVYAVDQNTGTLVQEWYTHEGSEPLTTFTEYYDHFTLSSNTFTVDMRNDSSELNNGAFPITGGDYTMYVKAILMLETDGQGGLPSGISNPEIYLNWITFDPIINHHTEATTLVEFTEIGANGFIHGINANNYFKVINENNTLTLEFLTGGTYGLKIDSSGIKYYNNGNWSQLNTP